MSFIKITEYDFIGSHYEPNMVLLNVDHITQIKMTPDGSNHYNVRMSSGLGFNVSETDYKRILAAINW